jgi:ABC-type branched-subunit amino acid transport system permease subunit
MQAQQVGESAARRRHGAWMRGEDLAALVLFGLLAMIPLLTSGYVVYILPQYMLLGMLAMSLAILWGYAGIVSFGQAAFFAVGAYAGPRDEAAALPINSAYWAFSSAQPAA